ncbi:MAG: hypothetical protein COA54_05970 [Thiotrichaceae bacterium]|nr:MAG: hypothetical protein COA54_05970 [Thiotrichaceae bacterium]
MRVFSSKIAYLPKIHAALHALKDIILVNQFGNELRVVVTHEINESILQNIVEEIRSGRAKAGLFIDKDFSALLIENEQPHITFYVDGTMPSLTTAMKYHFCGCEYCDV